jgi:predicted metal-dependent HD superfamily phosphohydrolase
MWENKEAYARIIEAARKLYDEPHRHYHTWDGHIVKMLNVCFQNAEAFSNLDAAILAIIFHDCVYSVDPDQYPMNESLSQAKMLQTLKDLIPDYYISQEGKDTIKLALRMISSTEKHDHLKYAGQISDDDLNDISRFLDIDLEVLATEDEENLMWYENSIRKEFSIYADSVYNKERLNFLTKFAKKEKFFVSDIAKPGSNKKARTNIWLLIDYLKNKVKDD